jgi:hypothetical protein
MTTPEEIDFRARVFVCGMRDAQVPSDHHMHGKRVINTGAFSAHLEAHPWVQRAQREGFGGQLRQHCIKQVKARMVHGADYTNVGDLMPEKDMIEHWAKQAEKFNQAADWRRSIIREYGSVDSYLGRGKRLDRNWSSAGGKRA